MAKKSARANIGEAQYDDLAAAAEKLQITRAEALRRALLLFKYAVQADKVVLKTDGKDDEVVVLK